MEKGVMQCLHINQISISREGEREGAHLFGSETLAGIVCEESGEEVNGFVRGSCEEKSEVLLGHPLQLDVFRQLLVSLFTVSSVQCIGVRRGTYGPFGLGGTSERAEDGTQLLEITIPRHVRYPQHEFGKDRTRSPVVDARAVGTGTEEELWWSIPSVLPLVRPRIREEGKGTNRVTT